MRWEDVLRPGVLIVSGKGGTGKSTVAAALAMAAASKGTPTLLAEVEGRGEIARTLGVDDPGSKERTTPYGFHVVSITPHEAVREYLRRYAGMRRVPRSLLRTGALDQVVNATPGLRDLLALGLIYETFELRERGARRHAASVYDLVIVDAPPTGQVASFLGAPAAFAGLVRVGRIRRQAASIAQMLRRRTRVVLVSLPDEMAVTETLEAVPAIHDAGVKVAAIVANRTLRQTASEARLRVSPALDAEEAVRVAKASGLTLESDLAADLLEDLAAAARTVRRQRKFVARLGGGAPVLLLPDLVDSAPDDRPALLARVVSGERTDGEVDVDRSSVGKPGRTFKTAILGDAVRTARIVVVCGSGGAGKTTISAAVAVWLAQTGRRTVLLTVDPARRLATALNLPVVPGERTKVPLGSHRSLDAIQLDTKRTFDELVERFATTPEQVDRILANSVYRRLTDTLSGTHEYMAMEKLHQLAEGTDYEAIVIDTPPTRSALAFLDAPRRLTDFLGGRFLRWIMWPSTEAGKLSLGAARVGTTAFLRTVGRLVGTEALADTAEFLGAFQGMYGGFKERAAQVVSRMRSDDCQFVVVAAPAQPSLEEAGYFLTRLSESGMRAGAVALNRWHRPAGQLPAGTGEAMLRLMEGSADERTLAAALAERVRQERRAALEGSAVARFAASHRGAPLVAVPELEKDVHDVPTLRTVAAHLFGDRDA